MHDRSGMEKEKSTATVAKEMKIDYVTLTDVSKQQEKKDWSRDRAAEG